MLKKINFHTIIILFLISTAVFLLFSSKVEYEEEELFHRSLNSQTTLDTVSFIPFKQKQNLKIKIFLNKLLLCGNKKGDKIYRYHQENNNSQSRLHLFDKVHYISYPPLVIYNEAKEIMYTSKYNFDDFLIFQNKLYSLNSRYGRKGKMEQYLRIIQFEKRYRINEKIFLFFLILVLLYLIFILTYHLFSIPDSIQKNRNYHIQYNIFNLLIFHRIINHQKSPSFYFSSVRSSKREGEVIWRNKKLKESYRRYFIYISIYQLSSWSREDIISHLSEYMNIKLAKLEKYIRDFDPLENDSAPNTDIVKKYHAAINEIKKQTEIISGITKIENPGFVKTDLAKFLLEIQSEYILNQPELKLPQSSLTAQIDKSLLKTAIKNLIDNSNEYLSSVEKYKDQQTTISLQAKTKNQIAIIIQNPITADIEFERIGTLGYTTKRSGTGIGILLAKRILLRHDGELNYYLKDSNFVVELNLQRIK